MKNLKYLSNKELDFNLQTLVKKEREILGEILLHIMEVDRRRLYLEYAYPNLFEYLTKHLGYSAGSAQRRIDSARLSKELPGLVECLETGDVNLAQVSLLQKSIRQVEKVTRSGSEGDNKFFKIPSHVKFKIIDEMKGKSFQDSQKLVAEALNLEIKTEQRLTYQADDSIRMELSFSKNQWEKLLKMRDLLSHSLPNGSWDEVFEYVADKVIAAKIKTRTSPQTSAKTSAKTAEVESRDSQCSVRKAIPSALKRQILGPDACCQFKSKITQKVCGSTWQLEVQHLMPIWAGGRNEPSNLSVLCSQHNKHIYRKEAGIRWM